MYYETTKDAGETSGGEGERRRSPAEMRKGDELRAALVGVIDSPKLRVHGRLSKRNPFIGYFHHAPSAGNRSRSTYFEKDITSMEAVRWQHEVRTNPMIGIFHYGHDLYGARHVNFQRILAQLREKSAQREVQAMLDRQSRPFAAHAAPVGPSHEPAPRLRRRARSIPFPDSLDTSEELRLHRCSSTSTPCSKQEGTPGNGCPSAGTSAGRVVPRGTRGTRAAASNGGTGSGFGRDRKKQSDARVRGISAAFRAIIGRGKKSSAGGRATHNGGVNAQDEFEKASGSSLGGEASPDEPTEGDTSAGDGVSQEDEGEGEGEEDEEEEEEEEEACLGVDGDSRVAEKESEEVGETYQERERRRLRANAFAIVVYASGDNLVNMMEKERRNGGATKRFKYAGAIDTSKRYPNTGSLDDCALLRPLVSERSRLYNDLIAETNGFRKHFFLRQKMRPREAYRQARRQREADPSWDFDSSDEDARGRMQSDSSLLHDPSMRGFGRSYSSVSPEVSSAINAKRNIGVGGMRGHPNGNGGMRGHPNSNGGGMPGGGMPGGGGLGMESGGGYYHDTSHALGTNPAVDDVLPFYTLVGPGQRPRHGAPEEAQPGNSWVPGTVSAQRTKESWRSKQEMRDFRKFKPFFVQAKTDFTATYKLLENENLGEGSYATVYLAIHIERQEEVAVKAVQKRLLFSEKEKKSVRAEIDNQLRIVHKHIVRLYEVYETPDHIFMVLEHCPSGDLEKMLYLRGRLTEIEAKRVTMQLLGGLDYIHGKGIVHCDIKPQNLLFADDPDDPDTRPSKAEESRAGSTSSHVKAEKMQVISPAGRLAKLCDFGLSCKVPDVRFYKQTGDIHKIPWSGLFGTGGYIAPEIMRQEAFGKPADLWSVGVVLYQMVSGRLPFIPARACLSKEITFPSVVWSNVSPAAQDLMRGLLDKDPSQRLTAAQALQHPWIQSIHHLRPSFPHFVPRQGSS